MTVWTPHTWEVSLAQYRERGNLVFGRTPDLSHFDFDQDPDEGRAWLNLARNFASETELWDQKAAFMVGALLLAPTNIAQWHFMAGEIVGGEIPGLLRDVAGASSPMYESLLTLLRDIYYDLLRWPASSERCEPAGNEEFVRIAQKTQSFVHCTTEMRHQNGYPWRLLLRNSPAFAAWYAEFRTGWPRNSRGSIQWFHMQYPQNPTAAADPLLASIWNLAFGSEGYISEYERELLGRQRAKEKGDSQPGEDL